MLADEQATAKQIEIFRAMPGERRLRLAEGLYWSARRMKIAGLRAQHPGWSEERLQSEVRRIFLMPEAELFLLFVRPLNRAGIRYIVTGSVAAIFYGEPRLTHDVDFVVFLNDANIQALRELFPASDF